ncbi:MAG: hypothetical protein HY303_10145 [Candidatus Wallbacteria bacterium]|nr:hypothetical protein [Candidatus Wallbacteria bacterium]
MDQNRWFVLTLLSVALIGTIVYLWLLGKRIARLKEILDRAPRDDGPSILAIGMPAPPKPTARVEGVPVGSLFGDDAKWVEEAGISGQRAMASGPPPSTESGKTMLDRFGKPGAAPPPPPRPPVPGAAAGAEGELLKKLLTFDSGAMAQSAAAPMAPPPADGPRAGGLLASFGAGGLRPPPPKLPEGTPVRDGSSAPPMASGMLGRLGAFSSGEAGAPESAKSRPAPDIKPLSFSLGPPPTSQPPAADSALSPLAAFGQGDSQPAAAAESPTKALKSLLSFGAGGAAGESMPPPIVRKPAEESSEAPPRPGGSILGRLGGPESPRADAANPLGSLMSRLGDRAGEQAPPLVLPRPGEPRPEPPAAPPASASGATSGPTSLMAKFGKAGLDAARLGQATSPALDHDAEKPVPAAAPTGVASSAGFSLRSKLGKPETAPPALPAQPKPDALAALAKLSRKVPEQPAAPAPPAKLQFRKPAQTAVAPPVDVEALEQAFMQDQENITLKRQLAEGYLSAGRFDFAAEAFTELVEGAQGQDSDLFNLGVAQARTGGAEDAIRTFTTISEQRKGTPWAAKAIAQLLKLKLARPV